MLRLYNCILYTLIINKHELLKEYDTAHQAKQKLIEFNA